VFSIHSIRVFCCKSPVDTANPAAPIQPSLAEGRSEIGGFRTAPPAASYNPRHGVSTPGRRELLLSALFAAVSTGTALAADDWKKVYPELTFAATPAENASGVGDRYRPFVEYLSKELGVPIKLRIATDYAAVIEGQRAGNIHIAAYGPGSYAKAYLTGVKIEPFATPRNDDGTIGYYSVIYVKNESPYKNIEDLRGKVLAFVDPNSSSGYDVPRYYLKKAGIDADAFFGKTIFAGSHENALIALDKGMADAAANWWNQPDDSNLTRMDRKGMLNKDDFRIVFKSDLLPGPPYAYLSSLPRDLKRRIEQAFAEAPQKNKTAFDRLSDGKDRDFAPVTREDYDDIIEMTKSIDAMRKRKS
jgi:phosphonate transport system substrate-binding protein